MEKWIYYAILSMIFAGITSVIAKLGMKDLSSDTALAIRTGVVFLIVLANAFIFKDVVGEISKAPTRNFTFLILSGITTSISWIFYYRAMKVGPVSYVSSIDKASIVVTILLSFILLKEPMTAKLLTGAGIIVIGLLVLIWK